MRGYHVGRSWTGNPLERACPCPLEPCGLVDPGNADPECPHHPTERAKSMRQGHPADQCQPLEQRLADAKAFAERMNGTPYQNTPTTKEPS